MPVVADGQVVLALVRGDDRLDEGKLAAALGVGSRPAQDGRDPGGVRGRARLAGARGVPRPDRAGRGAPEGSVRRRREPHGLSPPGRRARPGLRGRDRGHPSLAEGDTCPASGGVPRFQTAIEVGHIFKLGTFYSVPLDATYLDEQSVERPIVMGATGSARAASSRRGRAGPRRARDRLAALRRAVRHPRPCSSGGSAEVESVSTNVAEELAAAGRDCSSTTAMAVPGRSSPMPTSSACRSGSPWGRRASRTAPSTCAAEPRSRTRALTGRL